MDIARPDRKKKRQRQRIIYGLISLIALAGITMGLQQLKPAAPGIDRNTVTMGTVERATATQPFLRLVHGNGRLVPEEIRWVPAANSGRVEEILALVGAEVQAETVLVILSNPELQQAAFEAEWSVKAAEAQLKKLGVDLESQKLTQEASVAQAQARFNQAKLEAEVNEELAKDGLVPAIELKKSKANASEYENLWRIEQERLKISADAAKAQLAVQEATVAQLRAQWDLKKRHVELLKVRAGIDGVLQKLGDQYPLQIGQQVSAGATIARVANPKRLKAELKVAETQIRDITFGQVASIDMRNNTLVKGKVTRIDPAAENGTFTVDIALEGDLPRGARPDLSVDGTIELERLENVIYVGRPVNGQSDSMVGLFKLIEGGKAAVRIPVKLGRSSVNFIEVVEGLQPGEQVILSDMSQYDLHDRVRLN